MKKNNRKVLGGVVVVLALLPVKLAMSQSNVWWLLAVILFGFGIYMLFTNSKYIKEENYYNSLNKQLGTEKKEANK